MVEFALENVRMLNNNDEKLKENLFMFPLSHLIVSEFEGIKQQKKETWE